ncbi:MAG: molybdate ABC transporter substrate-binding protein [Boseongicola sp.]
MKRIFAYFAVGAALCQAAIAGEVTVATASNFLPTAETIAERFEAETEHSVVLMHGSTGQLYAQILSGAPIDIYLSADRQRPLALKNDGLATGAKTYAHGRLVLVSRVAVNPDEASSAFEGKRVGLADPIVAPYGLAATSAMERLNLDTATFQPLLVANVGQVATLFATGNVDLAFISASLLPRLDAPFVLSLEGRHRQIRQDAALLARAADNEAANEFWSFLFSERAGVLIEAGGHGVPE